MHSNEKDGVLFVRLFRGEDVPSSLLGVCRERGITSGVLLSGIGMLRDIELNYFSGSGYDTHSFPEPMELVSLSGNIARDGDGILIHAHAALAAPDGRMMGGHFSKGTVAATAEIVILRTQVPAERRVEPETGLKGYFSMTDQPIRSLLVSLGGNAIIPARGAGTYEEQRSITARTMHQVALLYSAGTKLLLTHGNGPIVGNILIRNEAVRDRIPPMPLDVCGADSQGGIGYMMQQVLGNELGALGCFPGVVTLVTQVVVSRDDPAFKHPTKPIGPFYAEPEARLLSAEKGWAICSDAGRGFRRVVPSPRPVEIVEISLIRDLVERGHVVIAVGGGGVPVVRESDGRLRGVEAVIDKDLASTVAANALGLEGILFVTGVEKVALDFGKPSQRLLDRATVSEMRRYLADGQFPPGSMGPKIEAAIEFIEGGGRAAIISSCQSFAEAFAGRAGTWIVSG